MDARPVGMFDSGVGGLSVLREFQRLAPHERVIYFADTNYFPYGSRPAAEVRKRAFAIVQRLLRSDVKMVVVACNTASAAALKDLREAFGFIEFVGMVPGLKPAVQTTRSKHVAVLATPGTLEGDLLQQVAAEFGRGVRIEAVPAQGLAEMVESGAIQEADMRQTLRTFLAPAVSEGTDTVVLGCTHYSFVADVLAQEFPGVKIVDTAAAVAARAVDVLQTNDLLADDDATGGLDLIVTRDPEGFRRRMAALGFLPQPAEELAT